MKKSCAFILFLMVLLGPAAAVQAVPPGTAIENTARALFRAGDAARTVLSNTVTVTTTVMRTPSAIELLQYAPTVGAAEAVTVPFSGYSGDGEPGGAVEPAGAIYPAGGTTPIDLSQPVPLAPAAIYHQSEPVFFRVTDADQNRDPLTAETVWIVVANPDTGDTEMVLLTETGPDAGVFVGYLQSSGAGPVQAYDGVLDAAPGTRITAHYTDPADSSDAVSASALVDPYGLVFDSATGLPVDGVSLTLVNDLTGQPAVVYGDDGVSLFPATIVSGGTHTDSSGTIYAFAGGHYRFPFVPPGTYRLVVQPPAGYAAPSAVATAALQALPGGPFVIAEPGSRGEPFIVNPGPAIRLDVPVDPIHAGLWVRKTVNRDVAAVGDFVQYAVTVENGAGVTAADVVVADRLPLGFRYRRGSARMDGGAVADPAVSADGRTLTFAVGELADGAARRIRYVTEIGAGAKPGKAMNRAQAAASGNLTSNIATAVVTVKEDLFRSKNIIVGRVIADNCTDAPTGVADGVAGVRIYLQDGTYVITDEQGRYHFEGVGAGTHVVQLDLASLPERFAIADCHDDTRWAGTPFSRFVEVRGGTLWRVDFHVRSATPLPDSRPSQAPPPAQAPASAIDAIDIETLAPGFVWLYPAAGDYPAIPSIRIAIQHRPGETVVLHRNGRLVDPIHFDGTRTNRRRNVAVSYWRAVALDTGANAFRAVRKNRRGHIAGELSQTVHYAGPPVRAQLVGTASRLAADGRQTPVIAVRLTDKNGHPARFGLTGEYTVLPPYAAETKVEIPRDGLPRVESRTPRYTVGADGVALLPLQPTTRTGEAVVRLRLDGREQEIRAWLQPEAREWILVGLAEGTAGYNRVSGNLAHLREAGVDEDLYTDGRLAFFAKGRIKGQWLLTAAFDSSRDRDDPDTRLFQAIDPDTYYTLYGDATQQRHEAASIRKLYLKIERERFYALFGDYETGLTVTELSRYSRSFNGLKSEFRGETFGYAVFAADTRQAYIKDEIQGDGTSGLYGLSRRPILVNSDKVTIEVRDRFRSEMVLSSRSLTRFVDYSIDYDAGTLFFKAPVYSRDEAFNPVYIVVEYESEGAADEAYTYGGRGSASLMDGRVQVGATYIHEGPRNAEADLGGLDARIDLGGGIEARAEVSATRQDEGGRQVRGQGVLAQVSRTAGPFDGKVYYRQLGEGFGLGQQSGSETATRKVGADGAIRLLDVLTLAGEVYRHDQLATGAQRDLGESSLVYRDPRQSLNLGARLVEDRFDDGTVNRSTQVLTGASRMFLDNRLRVRLAREQSLGGNDAAVDFPTRTLMGAEYKLSDPVSLFAEHEITQGATLDSQSTRAGFKAAPWSGGQIGTALGNETRADGRRLFANLGLYQTWRINARWSLDAGLDRSHTITSNRYAPFNPNVPTAAGASEDFTAVTLGLGYKATDWSWAGRVEHHQAETRDKWGLLTGIAGEVRSGLGMSAGVKLFSTETKAGSETLDGEVRLSMAFRPQHSPWIVFNRLDYKFENRRDDQGRMDARRIVNNLNANIKPHHRWQMALQYGAKYVFDTIDQRSYTGYTDLIGVEARYNLTARWDLGVQAGLLNSWNAGQRDYRTGISVGHTLFKNAWLSLGYNITGFQDEDFSAGDFTAQGPFVQFRLKFDQQSVREMVDWFSR